MPTLNFPDSPALDEIYTSGLQSWQWDGISWNIVPTVSGGGEASIAVGPTAPVGPDDGDLWWDTDEPSLLNSIVDPVALVANATFQAELAASAVYNAVLNSRYPLGKVAYTAIPAVSGTTTTAATICTVTWDAITGRLYRVSVNSRFAINNIGQRGIAFIADNTDVEIARLIDQNGTGFAVLGAGWTLVTGTGSKTYKLRALMAGGMTGSIDSLAVGHLMVEDIGLV